MRHGGGTGRVVLRATLVGVLALAVPFASTGAQAGLRPLEIPDGLALRCRSRPAVIEGRAHDSILELRFEVGHELSDERVITVMYDSIGDPLTLTEMASEVGGADGLTLHGIVVAFVSADSVDGFHARRGRDQVGAPGAADSTVRAARQSELFAPLTEQERVKARELAGWLWDRRCGRR